MGDALKKVQSGEKLRIPAAAYNAFVDMARQAQAERLAREGEASSSRRSNTLVLIRNDSGADVQFGGVLGIDAPIFTNADNASEFRYRTSLKGVALTAEHARRFVVAAEPIASGKCGIAVVSGMAVVQVDVRDAAHEYAEIVINGSAKLRSYPAGSARILWKESASGVVWAVVALGRPKLVVDAKITGPISGAGGKYYLAVTSGLMDLSASGHLAMPEGQSGGSAENAIGINLAENGRPTHLVPNNTWVTGRVTQWRDDGKIVVEFHAPLEPHLFAVKCSQSGGSNGDKTTQCSFTYTVNGFDGTQLGSGLTPEKVRPPTGRMLTPASEVVGLGYYDFAGLFHLYDANEQFDTTPCPQP